MIRDAATQHNEFDFFGSWTVGERRTITCPIEGLNDALTGLGGGLSWWPSTFDAFSNREEFLKGYIDLDVRLGTLTAAQLVHRVRGHLPVGWKLTQHLLMIQSHDEDAVTRYAGLIGAEIEEGDFGFDSLHIGEAYGVFGALIRDDSTQITLRDEGVYLAFHGEFRHPIPVFGLPEPLEESDS